MDRYIDLHVHTTYSDGSFSPREVVRHAKRLGFSAIGIADHDEVGGVSEALWVGNEESLEIVPGVEITSGFNGKEIHILGYLMDHNDRRLRKNLQEARYNRFKRMQKMVDRLNELGIQIRLEAVRKLAGHGSLGRLHLARALFEEKIVPTVQEAFDLYIGKGKPAYVKKPRMQASTAIELITSAGGVPVLAHPKLVRVDDKIHELVGYGLKGIEANYAKNTPEETEKYLAIAAKFDLLVTGGSDCHGIIKDHMLLGTVKLPYRHLEELRACARAASTPR
jgi:predicted metal-dependent phosphoesterase TrpH